MRELRAILDLVAAGRIGYSRSKSRASKKSPKSRLTKIRNYGLISYVLQRNSFQGRRADPAGAGAGAGGTGNSPRAAFGPSLGFMPHQYLPANPAISAKNSLFGAVPIKVNQG